MLASQSAMFNDGKGSAKIPLVQFNKKFADIAHLALHSLFQQLLVADRVQFWPSPPAYFIPMTKNKRIAPQNTDDVKCQK